MRSVLMILGLSVAPLAGLIGCADEPAREADLGTIPEIRGADQRAELSLNKLRAQAPEAVVQAFMREHPNAGVTSVSRDQASTGRLLYEVTYVKEGRVGEVTYTADGTRIENIVK